MNNSSTFRAFAERMVSAGYRAIIVDISLCRGMDSTFLGILFSISQVPGERAPADVVVVNPSPHAMKLLESVGLDKVIKIKTDPTDIPDLLYEVLEECHDSHQRLETIREAHENLLRLGRRNEEQFGPFLRALTKELQ